MVQEIKVQSQVESYQKIFKMVLDASSFNIQPYKVWIKGKWSNSEKGVVPFPTPQNSSYWKGNFQVTLNYSQSAYCMV